MTTMTPPKKKPQNMDVTGFQDDPISVTETEKMGVNQKKVKFHCDINGVNISIQ